MICPLLAIASTLDKTGNSPYECQKEKCAWWIKENKIDECALKCIAIELITIRQK